MAAKKQTRGKGEGAIFQRSNGLWVARLELPTHDGSRRRKEITAVSKERLLEKLAAPRKEFYITGDLPSAAKPLEEWLTHWLDNIASQRNRPNTLAGYRSVITNQIIPTLGRVRLDKLTPEHVRRLHSSITASGRSSTYALNAHRVLAKALVDAEREGLVSRNVARLTDAPRKATRQLDALDVDEAIAIIERAVPELDGVTDEYDQEPARWSSYLLTGVRRGEMIGLEVDRVGADTLDMSWQMQRIPDISTAPADYEHRQIIGTMYWTRPKTRAGWRIIPLVDPLKTILERHIERTGPNPWGLVFTSPTGLPIDPDSETRRWSKALTSMGITDKKVRLHDLRHTTVDLLLEAGVEEDVVMEIVGHSVRAVTRGYKDPKKIARRRRAMLQLSELVGGG